MFIINGVLANDGQYKKMVDSLKDTCYSKKIDNTETYFIYARRSGVQIPENSCMITKHETYNNFYFDFIESREFILNKTMAFFSYCYNNLKFDYIFRTNCGSYVNLKLLKKFIKDNNIGKENVYLAIENKPKDIDFSYGSGAGILFSRDVIKKIIDNKEYLKKGIDDKVFGKVLIENCNIGVTKGALRKDLKINEINDQIIDDKCYHYYYKASVNPDCSYKIHEISKKKNLL